jgi:hypothetical protein
MSMIIFTPRRGVQHGNLIGPAGFQSPAGHEAAPAARVHSESKAIGVRVFENAAIGVHGSTETVAVLTQRHGTTVTLEARRLGTTSATCVDGNSETVATAAHRTGTTSTLGARRLGTTKAVLASRRGQTESVYNQ